MKLYVGCVGVVMLFCCESATARFEMLMAGPGAETNSLIIAEHEVAKLGYLHGNVFQYWLYYLSFTKDGRTVEVSPAEGSYPGGGNSPKRLELNLVIPGPASIRLTSNQVVADTGFVTVEILPELYPPDKTLVIPDGTSANIIMEKSLDLINWTEATPGIYNNTNSGAHVFFRINAEILVGP